MNNKHKNRKKQWKNQAPTPPKKKPFPKRKIVNTSHQRGCRFMLTNHVGCQNRENSDTKLSRKKSIKSEGYKLPDLFNHASFSSQILNFHPSNGGVSEQKRWTAISHPKKGGALNEALLRSSCLDVPLEVRIKGDRISG